MVEGLSLNGTVGVCDDTTNALAPGAQISPCAFESWLALTTMECPMMPLRGPFCTTGDAMCAGCTGHLSEGGDSACLMRGRESETKPTKQKPKHKTKHQNKKTSRKLQSFALYVRVRHGETWETLQPATRASNSRIICCSCLWSGFVRSGLVRTGLITAACHRSARKALQLQRLQGRMSIQQSANGEQRVRVAKESGLSRTCSSAMHFWPWKTVSICNCNGRRNCGLWWAFANAGHCLQVRQQAPDETSLNRGRSHAHFQQAPQQLSLRECGKCARCYPGRIALPFISRFASFTHGPCETL